MSCIVEYQCETCPRRFGSPHAVEQHMDALGHWFYDGIECREGCGEWFDNESDRVGHEIEDHFWCGDCDWYFQNANNARQVWYPGSLILPGHSLLPAKPPDANAR